MSREKVGELEIAAATVGMDTYATLQDGQTGVIRRLLKNEIRTLVKAIRRERMNYQTYETQWLDSSMGSMGFSLADRMRTLDLVESNMLNRLKVLDPKDADIY
jgi:3,4-dihydroxy-2-butanone 4-phosphate synthase